MNWVKSLFACVLVVLLGSNLVLAQAKGPEGGAAGGNILFEGTPEDLVKCKESYTAEFLKPELK